MSDPIKESFSKVKEDIYALQQHLNILYSEMQEIKRTLDQTLKALQQTDRHITPTDRQTHNLPLQGVKTPNLQVSTGNEGVPTDRQTDRQTDRHIQRFAQTTENSPPSSFHTSLNSPHIPGPTTLMPPVTSTIAPSSPLSTNIKQDTPQNADKITQIEAVSQVLDSLDNLKKDLRSKFKKLTAQEINIFSLIYSLQDMGNIVDYPLLAEKTSLSQSSIRDYVLKLIKKGIPVEKIKENNKQITLSIPENFKKIASLDTILSLREI